MAILVSVINVEKLKKYFGKVKAVDDISFEVKKGEIYGFLGPNGAGKTTTIRCMMNFLYPDGGGVKIFGKDAMRYSEELKKDIGYLSGEVNLYEGWTGKDHLNLVKNIRGLKNREEKLVDKLDFDPSKKVKNLSTGNKQKLGLILALMHKPRVLILDEPTMGLDPLLQEAIYDTLKKESEEGTTVFMSSHNLSEVERICDRVCIIKQGKIAAIESIPALKKKRLYTVSAYFDGDIPKDKLKVRGAKIDKVFKDGVELSIKGDIRPLLKVLDDFDNIIDIEIGHSTLEKVFLEFYK